jgi:hypothetical protein
MERQRREENERTHPIVLAQPDGAVSDFHEALAPLALLTLMLDPADRVGRRARDAVEGEEIGELAALDDEAERGSDQESPKVSASSK